MNDFPQKNGWRIQIHQETGSKRTGKGSLFIKTFTLNGVQNIWVLLPSQWSHNSHIWCQVQIWIFSSRFSVERHLESETYPLMGKQTGYSILHDMCWFTYYQLNGGGDYEQHNRSAHKLSWGLEIVSIKFECTIDNSTWIAEICYHKNFWRYMESVFRRIIFLPATNQSRGYLE